MAIHDRDYMRPDPASAWSAPRSVTVWVLAAQVAGMCALAAGREAAGRSFDLGWASGAHWTFARDAAEAGRVWTVLTHVLVDSFSLRWALDGVMWWFFGRMAEEALGRTKFAGFLAAALVAGCAAHLGASYLGAPPRFAPGGMSGLTALTAACLAYAALRDPGRPVLVLFAEVPLRILALIVVGLEAAVAFGYARSGGESVAAILGAGAYGVAAWKLGLVLDLGGRRAGKARATAPQAPRTPRDEPDSRAAIDARVDALLDKISQSGMASLTPEEHEFLRRASKRT